jgi:hypothetical protein
MDNVLYLDVKHRSNEDFGLSIPVQCLNGSLVPDLEGASAVCSLKRKGHSDITFSTGDFSFSSESIVIRKSASYFDGLSGRWSGDVLVRLPGNVDFVPAVILLDITEGSSKWAQ